MRPDVENAIKEFKINTFGNKKNIERVEQMVDRNERVIFITPTNAIIQFANGDKKKALPGIFVLTDKRALFSYKALSDEYTETFSLSEIKSVNSSGNGVSGGHIEIHTLVKSLDILVSYKKDIMQKILNTIRDTQNAFIAVCNAQSSANKETNDLSQIEKLYDLLQKGIITQEEFNTKKKQILGI